MKLANSVFETNSSGNVGIGITPNGTDKLLVGGHLNVTGNLTVSGTTLTINSTTMTVDDPIITLGGDTAPVADDNKDRGVEFRWHNGSSAKVGFFGFDDSTGKFTFIPDATNTSEVFTGTKGTLDANIEWSDILSKPTSISGYGITDAVTLSGTQTITGSKTFSVGPTVVTQARGHSTNLAASTAFVENKFRCASTSGVLDWGDDTNTIAGTGTTLLTGTATGGPGDGHYYFPFNVRYTTASGNLAQLAIGLTTSKLFMRRHFNAAWSDWIEFLTSENSGSIGLVNGTSDVRIPTANSDIVARTNGTERLRITAAGAITTGGETAPDVDAGGICINTGAADGKALTFKNSDVAHPFTAIEEADTYLSISKVGSTLGGVRFSAYSENDIGAFDFQSYCQLGHTAINASRAAFFLRAFKSDGASGAASFAANENLFILRNGSDWRFGIKGNGDILTTGAIATGGETAPDVDAGGICINTGTGDAYAQTFKNSDVAHPFSSNNEIDTYGGIRKSSATNGGFYLRGIAAGTTPGIDFAALTQTGQTSGAGVINFSAFRSNGATSTDSLLATHNLATFQNATSVVTTIKGNGDIFSSGGISTGGETSPDAQAGGITTYTVGGAGINLTMKNSAVNHGMTGVAEPDTYGILSKSGTTTGGLLIRGLSSGSEGLFITGQVTTPNTTTGYAPITLHASKANGTGTQSIAASESVLGIYNNSSASIVRVMGNGAATFSGNVTAPQFISTVTTGTAPFVISSTTRVNNLNVATAGIADTANELTTARSINGTLFKGSASITTANWGTGRQLTIGNMGKTVNGSANVSWTLDEIGAAPKSLTMNNQTGTTYELVLADAGKNITMDNGSANTLTIPANSSVAFPVGTVIKITQLGAGQTTVNITTDTLNKAATFTTKLAEQYSEAVITKMTSTMWVISGDLEPV